MALAQAVPGIPSSCSLCRNNKNNNNGDYPSNIPFLSAFGISRICVGSHSRKPNSTNISLNGRWRLSAVDTRIVQNASSRAVVEIPVTCYQETMWTGKKEKEIGNLGHKLWYTSWERNRNGVGILVDKTLKDEVVEIK
ncbi:hypothetical protein L484_025159 [Morus notabilis]|uniref:Uncharacterized protein n=1 Tax=Morus notabilis TaxID=981085 RepID=W9RAR0_9ROSA|nr:hypothetical protein L484_025159 [Morus notabilis]